MTRQPYCTDTGSVSEILALMMGSVEQLDEQEIGILDALGRVLSEPVFARSDVSEYPRNAPVSVTDRLSFLHPERTQTGALAFRGRPDDHLADQRRYYLARRGEKVLDAGTLVGPREIAVLAALGYSRVKVSRLPTASIIVAYGFGCRDPLCESAACALASQLRACGASRDCVISNDDLSSALASVFVDGLRHDLTFILTDADISIPDRVNDIAARHGARIDAAGATRGQHEVVGFLAVRNRVLFVLTGGIVSGLLNFEIFVRPVLQKMSGEKVIEREQTKARLERRIPRQPEADFYVWSRVQMKNGVFCATPLVEAPTNLASFAKANALCRIPAGVGELEKGDVVTATFVHRPRCLSSS
jgi:molybdopterin molybdotransferase